MTLRTLALAVCALALAAGQAVAQPRPRTAPPASGQPAPPTAPQPPVTMPLPPGAPAAPAPPPAPRREGQPINVKVELTILDQRAGAAPLRKTISVVVADGMTGVIRSASNYSTLGRVEQVPLNMDVDHQLLAAGKIRLRIGLQYDLPNSLAVGTDGAERSSSNLFTTQLREQLAVVVESGKSIVVAESADPVGDRKVTVEVKATVLR